MAADPKKIAKRLRESNDTQEQEGKVLAEQLALTDALIDEFDEIINKLDGKLPPLIDPINTAITAVQNAYLERISHGCRSDLAWVQVGTSEFSRFGGDDEEVQVWECQKDAGTYQFLGFYGAKYYKYPKNMEYGANVVETIDNADVNVGSTAMVIFDADAEYLTGFTTGRNPGIRTGDLITDALINPTIFPSGNATSVLGFGLTPYPAEVYPLSGFCTSGDNKIYADGKIGISNNSPSCKLAITDTAEHTAYASVTPSVTASMLQIYNNPPNETANDHATMQFGVNGGTHNRVASISAVVESAANRKLAFAFCTDEAGSRTEKMRIHGDGHVTKPLNPAFRARASSGGWKSFGNTSFNIMPFNATDCNNGNHYNTSTYKFTVPVSGNYYFYCQMQHDGNTGNGGNSGRMQIVVQGVAVIAYGKSGRQGETVSCGTVWSCTAGNVVYCEGATNITNPDDWHGDSYYSYFTGYLIG